MKHCKHFRIEELVPPKVFEDRGLLAWELMDERIIEAADWLRDEFGPATINDWFWGGNRTESGLRTPDCTFYRPYSQHTFGRALDIIFKDADADDVRAWMTTDFSDERHGNPAEWMEVTGIEDGISWVHIDCRNFDGLKRFKP